MIAEIRIKTNLFFNKAKRDQEENDKKDEKKI